MHTFTGGDGSVWNLSLNVHSLERIRSLVRHSDGTPVDLWQIWEGQFLSDDPDTQLNRLLRSPVTLCQTLHAALECEFEEFSRAMDGDGLQHAAQALVDELIDFFPPSQRQTIRALLSQERELEEELQARLRQTHQETTERLRAELDSQRAGCAGNSPDSSDSTPAPSPSDS